MRLEPTKLILVNTGIIYQATGDAGFDELTEVPVWPLPETATGFLCNCLGIALAYTPAVLDAMIPPVRSKGSPPRANYLYLYRQL